MAVERMTPRKVEFVIGFYVTRPLFPALFECGACGPTNHVIGRAGSFVCCRCEEPLARQLARDRIGS